MISVYLSENGAKPKCLAHNTVLIDCAERNQRRRCVISFSALARAFGKAGCRAAGGRAHGCAEGDDEGVGFHFSWNDFSICRNNLY